MNKKNNYYKNSKDENNKDDLQLSDELICYCFKYSKKDVFNAVKSGNEINVINEIKDKMKDPGCFCKSANPSGKCCLNDLDVFICSIKK